MNELNSTSAPQFLKRFCNGGDGVILAFSIVDLMKGCPSAVVDFGLLDSHITEGEMWNTVRLTFTNVSSFCFNQPENYDLTVMTHGLYFLPGINAFAVDFGTLPQPPTTIRDFGKSNAFVVAESAAWIVTGDEHSDV